MYILYDPAILLLGICTKECIHVLKKSTKTFIVGLFKIAKNWK